MLTCKQATRLMSEAQDNTLATRNTVQLRLHLLICRGCRNYQSQLKFLRQACQQFSGQTPDSSDPTR